MKRGGIGLMDDGSMNLCFDDAKVECSCLFFMAKLGNAIAFNDERRDEPLNRPVPPVIILNANLDRCSDQALAVDAA